MPKVSKGLLFLLLAGLALYASNPALAAGDPQGTQDSMWIQVVDNWPDSVIFQVRINTDNTGANQIAGIGLPFLITVSNSALVLLDTTVARTFKGAVDSAFAIRVTNTDSTVGGIDPTVSPVGYAIGAVDFLGGMAAGSNLLLASIKLRFTSTPCTVTIDTTHTGQLLNPTFTTAGGADYIPQWYTAPPFDTLVPTVDVKDRTGSGGAGLPTNFTLGQNYPNPFNATTQIQFALPQASHVKLEIFNVLGQRIRVLVDEDLEVGYKQVVWDGRDQSGNLVASGIYFYRLNARDLFTDMKKMLLIK